MRMPAYWHGNPLGLQPWRVRPLFRSIYLSLSRAKYWICSHGDTKMMVTLIVRAYDEYHQDWLKLWSYHFDSFSSFVCYWCRFVLASVACWSPYLGRVTIWLQPCRVSSTTFVVAETKLLVILDIRGDDEFKRVWLKPWISVSWRGKLSSLQPIRMYPLFEITNHSEPHIVYWKWMIHFLLYGLLCECSYLGDTYLKVWPISHGYRLILPVVTATVLFPTNINPSRAPDAYCN